MNYLTKEKKEILRQVKCFILDLDGTFYLGNKIIDGSLEFLEYIKSLGKSFYFFTNNSSRNASYYRKKLDKMGCSITEKNILTANQVIIKYLKKKNNIKIYLVGNKYLRDDFVNAKLRMVDEDPDIVVVGFDTSLDYQKVAAACHFIRNGANFYAVNPDFNCPIENGFLPDCGSICALITASTGKKPIVFGKPSFYAVNFMKEHTGFKGQDIVFIGDRLYTDIALGKDSDINTILVLSGETKKEEIAHSLIKPDMVFKSLKEIIPAIAGINDIEKI